MVRRLAALIPWWGKILVKVVLSRVPLSSAAWRRLGLFVHGPTDSPDYALRIVRSHLADLGWPNLNGKSVLELGPGNSLFTVLVAKGLGAKRICLVDVGPFASMDVAQYLAGYEYLEAQGLLLPPRTEFTSIAGLLAACGAEYMTNGIDDLKRIESKSVDLILSQAVLEHVKLSEMEAILTETCRLLSDCGVSSHEVDLRDHLANGLNNLRFSDQVWEGKILSNSGFYTNRIRYSEMLELFRAAGLAPDVVRSTSWEALPTLRKVLQPRFRDLPESDLLVSTFNVVARPVASASAGENRTQ